jgi:hypothetical protein
MPHNTEELESTFGLLHDAVLELWHFHSNECDLWNQVLPSE